MKVFRRFLICFAVLLGFAVLCLMALHKNSSIRTEIWIDSSPQQVWNVLIATAEYPYWNPMISHLTGELHEGSVIEFTVGAGSGSMTFHPKILRIRAAQELRWKGNVLIPGIFDGEHQFFLEPQGTETHLIQSEEFSGLLAGKLTQAVLRETTAQMKFMNLALKQRCESLSKTEIP